MNKKLTLKCLTAFALGLLASQFPASAFYNPTQGRWLSRDPIGERGGKNLYGFVYNDPIKKADIHGHSGVTDLQVLQNLLPSFVPPIIAYRCFQCGGKWYDPFTHCCCGGKSIKRGLEKTSVKICTASAQTFPSILHAWIEVGSQSIDVVASDSIYDSPGLVSVPSKYSNGQCTEVEIDRCTYDRDDFESGVKGVIQHYSALVDPNTGSYVDTSWNYSVTSHNCNAFLNEIIDHAKSGAMRKNCGSDLSAFGPCL